MKERYTFLKNQHDDLIAAAQSLEKIIEELDVQMRRQFKTQFARIQTEFDKVFKQLFGRRGGDLNRDHARRGGLLREALHQR